MSNPQVWQAIAAALAGYAALFGGAYAVITVPLRRAIKRAFHVRESGLMAEIARIAPIQTPRAAELPPRLARLEAELDDHAERITRLARSKLAEGAADPVTHPENRV